MCFSAEASFGTGVVLAIVGAVAVRKAETPSWRVFAMIPLFLSIQQCMEGILWLSLPHPDFLLWQRIGTYGFLLFAWVIWPTYIPFSVRLLEENEKRKKILSIVMGMGACVSLFFAYILIFHQAEAKIEGYHIQYAQNFQYGYLVSWIVSAFYFIPTVISLFISSIKRVWLLGIVVLISSIITRIFFEDYLISIWCFFAAVFSILVLLIIISLREKELVYPLNRPHQI
jgi:hypothetical protein